MIRRMKEKVAGGGKITREEARALYEAPLEELCAAADEIREQFCGKGFDLCTIVNGKSGRCSEDCKFCAQSSHYATQVEEYPILSIRELAGQAKYNDDRGVLRYSIVTSGKKISHEEVDEMCRAIEKIRRETGIAVCVSFGLLDEGQYRKLRQAGASRVHNNLETSRGFFPEICTTHTYDDKVRAIRAAQAAGMSVCSGGIMGLGETAEDRIDMALELRDLGIRSVPINFLNPIPGTPFEKNEKITPEEARRIAAVYRFILPDASIRLAGGRGLLDDLGEACFRSGANAAISGDMLTTPGITIEKDMALIRKLGYEPQLWEK